MCVESAGTGGVANSQYQRPVEDPRQKDGTATKQMPSGVVDSLQGKKPKTTKGAEVVGVGRREKEGVVHVVPLYGPRVV